MPPRFIYAPFSILNIYYLPKKRDELNLIDNTWKYSLLIFDAMIYIYPSQFDH